MEIACVLVIGPTDRRLGNYPLLSISRAPFGEQLLHLTVAPLNVVVVEARGPTADRMLLLEPHRRAEWVADFEAPKTGGLRQ